MEEGERRKSADKRASEIVARCIRNGHCDTSAECPCDDCIAEGILDAESRAEGWKRAFDAQRQHIVVCDQAFSWIENNYDKLGVEAFAKICVAQASEARLRMGKVKATSE